MTNITHITQVEIKQLWDDPTLNFKWILNPDVNVLAGDNGSGKSTIINLITGLLSGADEFPRGVDKLVESVRITFDNDSKILLMHGRDSIKNLERTAKSDNHKKKLLAAVKKENPNNYKSIDEVAYTYITFNGKQVAFNSKELTDCIHFDYITTLDQPLFPAEILKMKAGDDANTYMDHLIEQLEKEYLNYQIDIGKRALDVLSNKTENISFARDQIDAKKNLFLDMVDDLFRSTGKRIDRDINKISFIKQGRQMISPYSLSSGEKQILIILLTALVQDNQPSVMIMDEPEISLHTDWQESLINNIRKLNENVQLIIATHSPSIIIDGWQDKVFEIVDIQVK